MAPTPKMIGAYTIGNVIGAGGQGTVYEAIAGEGSLRYAIKVLEASSTNVKRQARFRQEIEQHVRLSQAKANNIMPIVDHNFTERDGGRFHGYIVMPRAYGDLEGQKTILLGRVELCLEIFVGILEGLKSAHEHNVIHRDIKPSNILFVDESLRNPLLSDFGICLLRDASSEARLTDVNETVGARFYMAPEQEMGGRVDVGPSADLYAAAKVLVYMLTSRTVYREEIDNALTAELLAADPRLFAIRNDVLIPALVRDPNGRVQSSDELQKAASHVLERTRHGSTNIAQPPQSNVEEATHDTEDATAIISKLAAAGRSVRQEYDEAASDFARANWNVLRLRFDDARRSLNEEWNSAVEALATPTSETLELASRTLITSQTLGLALALGMSRFDASHLGTELWRYLEMSVNITDQDPGYVSVVEIPALVGGFIYMAATTSCLVHRSWHLLRRMLDTKLELATRSGRGTNTYGFAARQFFHSEALGRSATRIHDLYRDMSTSVGVDGIMGLSQDAGMSAYVQAQFLMCIRAAQLAERGELVRLFANYGRYYSTRLQPLLDRAYADREFGEPLAGVFGETRDQWFAKLNERIAYVKANYWGNTTGFYESLDEWQPRQ